MKLRLDWVGQGLRYAFASLMAEFDHLEIIKCILRAYQTYADGIIQIFPSHRSHRVGPGVEMRDDPIERRRRNGRELDMYTALE
jgi:hypothetical protein